VAQAHLGEAVVARRRLARFRKRWLDDPFVEQRHRDQKNRAPQRKGSKKWVQYKDDSNIDRRPGKIEDCMDTHAGDELTEGIEIAQQLAARAAENRRPIDDGSHDPGGDFLVK